MTATTAYKPRGQMQRAQRNRLQITDKTVVHMNPEEFVDYAINVKKQQGMTRDQAIEWINGLQEAKSNMKEAWIESRETIKQASGYAPVAMDVKGLQTLAEEMRRGGKVFAKFRMSKIRGVSYVIIEGYSGLRRHLKGTRYLARNPKVVSFGIGKSGVANSLKQGFVLSILISAGFHAIDQLLNDKLTWHHFVGGMAVDIAVAVAAAGISWGLVGSSVAIAASMSVAVVAVVPIIALILVGTVTTISLNVVLDSESLSEQVADMLISVESDLKQGIKNIKIDIDAVNRSYKNDPIRFMQRAFSIPNFDYLSSRTYGK